MKFKGIELKNGTFTMKVYANWFRLYDLNGNFIYEEDTYDDWCRYEYNENGKYVYYEEANGYWRKNDYDNNNNLIYVENSTEGIILDKRGLSNETHSRYL